MTMASELINWAKDSEKKGHKPYLIIDSAQAENSHLKLKKWQVAYESLFDGKPEESVPEIAPLLIPMFDLEAESIEQLCEWAIKLAYKTPCFSWVDSVLPTAEFAGHLRNFHEVNLSEGQSMLMRWYDTRVLPVWLACLSSVQAKQFTASMLSLNYINRFGDSAELFRTQIPTALPALLPLGEPIIALTDTQYSMLVDASNVDTLVSHLRRVITDETNKVSQRTLVEFVGKYQQYAIASGLDDLDRQTQYVLLALYTSGKGADHPLCIELMKAPPKSLDKFHEAMQELPELVWEAGPPIWEVKKSL
jgi:Domain of unknown function (DUF4123)